MGISTALLVGDPNPEKCGTSESHAEDLKGRVPGPPWFGGIHRYLGAPQIKFTGAQREDPVVPCMFVEPVSVSGSALPSPHNGRLTGLLSQTLKLHSSLWAGFGFCCLALSPVESPEEIALAGGIQLLLIEMHNCCVITPESSGVAGSPLASDLQARREKNSLTFPSLHRAPFELITCHLSGSRLQARGLRTEGRKQEMDPLSDTLTGLSVGGGAGWSGASVFLPLSPTWHHCLSHFQPTLLPELGPATRSGKSQAQCPHLPPCLLSHSNPL